MKGAIEMSIIEAKHQQLKSIKWKEKKMTYGELKQAIENGDYDNYTDRVDVTIEISLFEYGILRDPEDGECLFYKDGFINEEPDNDFRIQLYKHDVSIDDVKDYLENHAKDGFFRYIGSSKYKEIERLDNGNLAHIISSINQWDGW
jgi:hypothetical protein